MWQTRVHVQMKVPKITELSRALGCGSEWPVLKARVGTLQQFSRGPRAVSLKSGCNGYVPARSGWGIVKDRLKARKLRQIASRQGG